jgi:hypothetical protein
VAGICLLIRIACLRLFFRVKEADISRFSVNLGLEEKEEARCLPADGGKMQKNCIAATKNKPKSHPNCCKLFLLKRFLNV